MPFAKQLLSTARGVQLQYLFWAVFGVAFVCAYFPVITSLVHAWSHSDDYSHGFIIAPVAAYMLWQKREVFLEKQAVGSWSGLLLATGALFLYAVSKIGEMQTIASLSMIVFLWGAVIFLFGYGVFRACFLPLVFLAFMIPVPAQIIARLTIPLQLLVTKASVGLASFSGIPIFHDGNIIQLPQGTFQVVQACSGLRSIMTMLTLGTVLAYFTLRSTMLRGTLLLLAVPIALAVNILRVFVLISALYFLSIDLSEGTLHTCLGLAVFGIALGLFLAAGKGLALWER
ncbi:exosortase [Oryzomonas sagensis]|nr:exosortase [Oryzomonas sagensis]